MNPTINSLTCWLNVEFFESTPTIWPVAILREVEGMMVDGGISTKILFCVDTKVDEELIV